MRPQMLRRGTQVEEGAYQDRLRPGTGAQGAGAVGGGHDNGAALDFFTAKFAGRVAHIEVNSAGKFGADAQSSALARQQDFRALAARARASGISETGMMATAPLARAVTMLLVARSTSKTTQTVPDKSRPGSGTNSAGATRTSSVAVIYVPSIRVLWRNSRQTACAPAERSNRNKLFQRRAQRGEAAFAGVNVHRQGGFGIGVLDGFLRRAP